MSDKKLLSIAEIARELEVPESTLHYWKNRFAQYLPSMGKKRQKRFKPQAVEIFSIISQRLKQGHTAEDVMSELSIKFPVNAAIIEEDKNSPADAMPRQISPSFDQSLQLASAIGAEIAKSITEGLKNITSPGMPLTLPDTLHEDMEQAVCLIKEQGEDVDHIKEENRQLKEKLSVMEAEMVRLRKDRRELEKYLLDKLKAVTK